MTRSLILPFFSAAAISLSCTGCKTTREVTTRSAQDPILEKFASNFDNSQGLSTSSESSEMEAKAFDGIKSFNTRAASPRETDMKAYDGERAYDGVKEYNDVPVYKGAKNRGFRSFQSEYEGRRARFSKRNRFKSPPNFLANPFPTKELTMKSSRIDLRADSPMTQAELHPSEAPIIGESGESMSVDEVRTLLGR